MRHESDTVEIGTSSTESAEGLYCLRRKYSGIVKMNTESMRGLIGCVIPGSMKEYKPLSRVILTAALPSRSDVTFTVHGEATPYLYSYGLDECDASGTPRYNRGAVNTSAPSATSPFTWASGTPGTYYFKGYAWATDGAGDGPAQDPD